MTILNKKIKEQADAIDNRIIDVLKSGNSFIVEAGAGSGKTYSLLKVIDWLEQNKCKELKSKKKKIACITYTNAAVNVILERLSGDSSIAPSTIHSFAWDSINQFQQTIIKYVNELGLLPKDSTIDQVTNVAYMLGSKYIDNGTLYLFHDDVIKLFAKFLDNEKFRRLLSLRYPIVLIDEYQDSFKILTDKFIEHFVEGSKTIQFGFFGDSWQTIYTSNGACGKIESNQLIEIQKTLNFRSNIAVVNTLNAIRPNFQQEAVDQQNDGQVFVITTRDYKGIRQGGYYKSELAQDDLINYVDNVKKQLERDWNGAVKTLMITHKMLANQQHYANVLKLLGDSFKEETNEYLKFFRDIIEPLYIALSNNNINDLCDALKTHRTPIESKLQKKSWHKLYETLKEVRSKKIVDVIDVCISNSQIIPVPTVITENHKVFLSNPDYVYNKIALLELYNTDYSEIVNAIAFISPQSDYSTEHGVKGEEYENVLFIIGRGWNNYKFDEQVYLDPTNLSEKEYDIYIRNRNLFYVCCSRSIKRLAIFVTVPINSEFQDYLERIVGKANIYTYNQFIDKSTTAAPEGTAVKHQI